MCVCVCVSVYVCGDLSHRDAEGFKGARGHRIYILQGGSRVDVERI